MIVTLLVFQISLDSPWAVAAPQAATAIDRPLAKDGQGRPFVPAASLAGSLRRHLAADAARLLGSPPPRTGAANGRMVPSPLRLLGTSVSGATTQLVRSTAIDRTRGAARPKTLRSAVTASAGTSVALFARYDGRLEQRLLDLLAAWQPAVGGGRSIGLGRAHLTALRWGTLDLADPAHLRTWLLLGGPALFAKVATHSIHPPEPPPRLWLRTRWRITDGVLLAAGTEGSTTKLWRRDGQPWIEGASLKGVLRSRAEFILRSLDQPACDGTGPGCGACPACVLFGARDRRGALAVRAAPIEAARIEHRTHAAIDRITGGAANRRLFDEEVVVSGRFELVLDALDAEIPPAGRRLVLHVLADLHDGLVGIGSRGTRGLGTIELDDPTVLAELSDPSSDVGRPDADGAPPPLPEEPARC